MTMTFCGETPFAPPFTNDNFSGCFVLTLHAVLPAAYITIFGLIRIIQLLCVKEKLESLPQSNRKLILTVTTITWLEIILPLLLLTMLVKETAGSTYQILALSLTGASWLFSWIVLRVEKSIRSQYSFLVPIYWVLSLVTGALELFYHSKKLAIAQSKSNESLEDKISFSVFVVRYAFVVAINIVGVILMRSWTQGYAYKPLPGSESIQGDHSESIKDSANGKPEHPSVKAPPRASSASPWIGVLQKLAKLFPFVWPKHDRKLQFYVVLSFTLLLVQRVINVYVPIYQSIVVDALAGEPGGVPFFPWQDILLYVFLRFLQGGAGGLGLFNNWRSLLWIRVEQYTTREISVTTFAHLHQLSLRYHLQRKTGEVLRVIDRGTASITALLSAILFNILPTILDIIISVIYFSIAFDIYFGIIVFASMIGYMAVTIWITEWRTRFRREMIEADNDAKQKSVDSLLNFETVKYHSAETYEVRRFRNSILNYNEADWKSQSSLVLLNSVQNIIITAGLLAGLMLAAWQVVKGDLTVGDYTLFLSYILQLYGPLNWFGTYYRSIQQNFIDMEKMLDLLNQNVEIQDDPDAPELVVTKGELEFENVVFNYDSRITALRGISFKVPAGQTVALVGQSGSGKTTIMRLVFRFYDVTSGRILIDGQDIRRVTQHSLRRSIGVVPQDTVLFNDTIEYNIQYGDLEVEGNEELLRAAAKKAQIHDKILTFPDGYQTMVGERGLRLSGGEKQRVAIARTLLKNPKIVLLDEATSALDTETERQIQASLAEMSQNRTTLVIAHRLSTIINADMILVLREGEIVERGTHEELLQQQGEYYKLWQRQLESDHEAKTKTPDTKT